MSDLGEAVSYLLGFGIGIVAMVAEAMGAISIHEATYFVLVGLFLVVVSDE